MFEREDARNTGKVCGRGLSDLGVISWSVWVVFLVLKCVGVLPATFSWFWVWFPFWLPFAIAGAIFIVVFIVMMVYFAVNGRD